MIIAPSLPGEPLEATQFHQLNARFFRGTYEPNNLPPVTLGWVVTNDSHGRIKLNLNADVLVWPLSAGSVNLATVQVWQGAGCSPLPRLTEDNDGLLLATEPPAIPGEHTSNRWDRLESQEIRPEDPRGHMLVLLRVRPESFVVDFDSRQYTGIVVIAADVRSSVGLVPPHRCEFKYL